MKDADTRKIVISVKGGKLKADDVRVLNHVREREKAEIALLIALHEPTPKMKADAASAGIYEWDNKKKTSPRIQLITIEGLLSGAHKADHPDYVPDVNFKKARREQSKDQGDLFGDAERTSLSPFQGLRRCGWGWP